MFLRFVFTLTEKNKKCINVNVEYILILLERFFFFFIRLCMSIEYWV